jgi:hypothetical protein
MLNDVPVFSELAVTHSENHSDNYGRSACGRRESRNEWAIVKTTMEICMTIYVELSITSCAFDAQAKRDPEGTIVVGDDNHVGSILVIEARSREARTSTTQARGKNNHDQTPDRLSPIRLTWIVCSSISPPPPSDRPIPFSRMVRHWANGAEFR